MNGRVRLLPLVLVAVGVAVSAARAGQDVERRDFETEHYHGLLVGTPAQNDEAEAVLEAAWPQFKEFFGRTPRIGEGERLRVEFHGDRDAWAQAIRDAGSGVPAAGGYYWPPTRTVYLYRQPTAYYTRTLLIHEAAHQFHWLARTDNAPPSLGWYNEGVAEHLAWHTWDGETLRLGVVPPVSLLDYPAKALAQLSDPDLDFAAAVHGQASLERPAGWAVVSWLLSDDRLRRRYERWAMRLDARQDPAGLFRQAVARPSQAREAVLDWLRTHQQPWQQVFNEWEGIGPGRMQGTAPSVVSLCRLAGDAGRIRAELVPPASGRWTGGLVLSFQDSGRYTIAMIYGDQLRVERMDDGWSRLGTAAVPPREGGSDEGEQAGGPILSAVRDGDTVTVSVNDRELLTVQCPPGRMGLAVRECRLRFRDVTWE